MAWRKKFITFHIHVPLLKTQAVTNTIYLAFKKITTFTSITRNEARARKKTTSRDPQPPETTENGANLLFSRVQRAYCTLGSSHWIMGYKKADEVKIEVWKVLEIGRVNFLVKRFLLAWYVPVSSQNKYFLIKKIVM